MGAVYFEATADSKGRLEIPKKFKTWFSEPVSMRYVEDTGTLYVAKDFEGGQLDNRRRLTLARSLLAACSPPPHPGARAVALPPCGQEGSQGQRRC